MTDVIVVGGGIAGSALAILLGRAGLRVELYERGSFPREKPCGEGLMPAGWPRWGAWDCESGRRGAFVGVRYHVGRLVVPGRFPRGGRSPRGRYRAATLAPGQGAVRRGGPDARRGGAQTAARFAAVGSNPPW